MHKGIFISDLPDSGRVEGLFCVASKVMLETRNGNPYLALVLLDRTGEVQARVWDAAQETASLFEKGDYLWVQAEAQVYRDTVQLKISGMERVPPEQVDHTDFLPSTPEDTVALWSEFRRYMAGISDPVLGVLLREVFSDRQTATAFRAAPAAKHMHHAYLGGLLEHSVSVARLARTVCGEYPDLDRDLLLSAALIHDIGKTEEFSFDAPPIDYTDRGRLIGHLVLGAEILDRFTQKAEIPRDHPRIMAIKHLVLSHHGQREFGAPVLPMTREAVVLHLLDDMDAKLNYLNRLSHELPPGDYAWTQYQRPMERFFFLRGATPEEQADDEAPDADEKHLRQMQQGLWAVPRDTKNE